MASSLRVGPQPGLREQVVDKIREAIAGGALAPGERLVERVLCEKTGVSRTSLREALRELESEGLITSVRNRGIFVTELDSKLAASVLEVRHALEVLIVTLFAERATPHHLVLLRDGYAQVSAAYVSGHPSAMIHAKTDFYDVLMEGAENPVAAQMLRSIHIRVSQLRRASLGNPHREENSLAEIRRLVEAIEARDVAAAERVCREHLENAADAALASLARADDGENGETAWGSEADRRP